MQTDEVSVILISLDGLSKVVRVPRNKKLLIKNKTDHGAHRAYIFNSWFDCKFLKQKIRVFKEMRNSDQVKLAEKLQETIFR